MSHPLTIYWPSATTNGDNISKAQGYLAAGNLILNSNVPSSQVNPANPNSPYIFDKVARTVSFTSAVNLSALTLTITGIGSPVDGNGNPTQNFSLMTENGIVGPNAGNTVESTYIWKQINSIHISGSTTSGLISAGFGSSGITDYMFMDSNRTAWYATAQVDIIAPAGLGYIVYQSLTKPETPNNQYGNLNVFPNAIPAFPVPYLVNNTANSGIIYAPPTTRLINSALFPLTTPVAMVWANISNNAEDSLYFTTLQQGLRS